jgi:hypothetical protein
MNPYKRPLANICIAVLAMVITLGALEAALAITKFNVPAYMHFLPRIGRTFIPHAYYRYRKERFSEGHINSHGFRDYERSYEKSKDVYRILVLGDSYIEGFQVQLKDTFTAQLEKMLNAHPSAKRFEVLSFGQSGFGTAEEYLRYITFGLAYDPDLVILAVTTGNDFRDNSKFLNRGYVGNYFVFNQEHHLVLDSSVLEDYEKGLTYPRRVFQALKTHFHLFSLMSERLYLLNLQLAETRMSAFHSHKADNTDSTVEDLDVFSDLNIYRRELPEPWKEAVEISKEIIRMFKKSVEEHGSRFVLLALSNHEQVHSEIGNQLKIKHTIEFDFEQPDRILEELAEKNRITYLKLMPALRNFHLKTGLYLHGFGTNHEGHWNETGHRLGAELTYQFLRDRHLVPFQSESS